MPDPARRPLYYTFGNHMHWVDMQWLWGYHVLPGSVRDMLRLIDETGARGNVNFDAVGFEKMAAECPEALAELREAIAAGKVEPVGCSYGQPYGLFHGGESNVRQLTYGVRTTRRLLGVRPRAFWEEEFYFFPQLPQLLAQCGYTGACLFFQWTWHTPEVPREPCSLILWEGIDGTRLPTLPRNDLNLHQWPEDFDGLLERAAKQQSSRAANGEGAEAAPAIVQWLELMPSRDWMCRSEVLLPRLKELLADPRFDVRPRTVSTLIQDLSPRPSALSPVPVRRYAMDDVWHGMTLGKNADRHPRASAALERRLIHAESLSALTGLFGRPYASWDVYPTWELDEAWRKALAAQHHDNHECEGLCGFIGHFEFGHAAAMADEVMGRASWLVRHRTGSTFPEHNGLGWERTISRDLDVVGYEDDVRVPPFGYAPRRPRRQGKTVPAIKRRAGVLTLSRGGFSVRVDRAGCITDLAPDERDSAKTCSPLRLGEFRMGDRRIATTPRIRVDHTEGRVYVEQTASGGADVRRIISIAPVGRAVDLHILPLPPPTALHPGLRGSFQVVFQLPFEPVLHAGTPYAGDVTSAYAGARRKYPTGDWMTAPQKFERVDAALTACGFLDLVHAETGGGILICHDACLQWFARGRTLTAVATAIDPWDEGRYDAGNFYERTFRVIPHAGLRNADRARAAIEFAWDSSRPSHVWSKPVGGGTAAGVQKDVPKKFGCLEVCNAPGVLAHAFFRESMKSGEHLPDWAGHRIFRESGGACDHPYVIRLVEWNGEPAEVVLKLPGPVAMAAKTNLLGEVRDEETERRRDEEGSGWSWADTGWLKAEHPVEPPSWAKGAKLKGKPITWSAVCFRMRPREIATIYADLVMGRKQWRDLDAKREVWATVHRT